MSENKGRKPRFEEFDPKPIRWQHQLISDYLNPEIFDWSKGVHTIVLSGAVGSAKSLLCAHLTWLHLLRNKGAEACLTRLDRRRLKDTSWDLFLKHRPTKYILSSDVDFRHSNYHLDYNKSELSLKMLSQREGDDIILNKAVGMYYSDWDYDRFRSNEYSFFHIEEAVESPTADIYKVGKERTRLNTDKREKLIVLSTNPGEPDSWINTELISKAGWVDGKRIEGEGLDETIHVYYSLTSENPFIDKSYVDGLLKSYNEMETERYIRGKWVSLYGESIYYAYGPHNHRREAYKIDYRYPIRISFDFNTAQGKPMSCVLAQWIEGKLHFFNQYAIQGDTQKLMNELISDGVFDHNIEFKIHGDASGHTKQPSSSYTDYGVIKKTLENYRWKDKNGVEQQVRFSIVAGKSNPEIKIRHNTMNSYFKNGAGEARIFLYEKCFQGKVNLDMGFRLTKLKEGAKYVEDDGPQHPYQHATSTCGYLLCDLVRTPASVQVYRPS